MSAAQIKMWHIHFKDGQEPVESDPCSRRPTTSRTPENVQHVQAAINKDWRLTVRELEADLGIPKPTVSDIFDTGSWHEMCYGKICFASSSTRAEGTSGCHWENCVRSQGAYFEGN